MSFDLHRPPDSVADAQIRARASRSAGRIPGPFPARRQNRPPLQKKGTLPSPPALPPWTVEPPCPGAPHPCPAAGVCRGQRVLLALLPTALRCPVPPGVEPAGSGIATWPRLEASRRSGKPASAPLGAPAATIQHERFGCREPGAAAQTRAGRSGPRRETLPPRIQGLRGPGGASTEPVPCPDPPWVPSRVPGKKIDPGPARVDLFRSSAKLAESGSAGPCLRGRGRGAQNRQATPRPERVGDSPVTGLDTKVMRSWMKRCWSLALMFSLQVGLLRINALVASTGSP